MGTLPNSNGMSIQEVLRKFKDFWYHTDTALVFIIVITAGVSFMLGRLSLDNAVHIQSQETGQTAQTVSSVTEIDANTTETVQQTEAGKYVASKTGTKYHLPWCGGAKSIKEENKVWFETKEEAEGAGYLPASNCKGI